MRFVKKAAVHASAEKVWNTFARDFDNAYVWMASVPHSFAQANGSQFEGAQSCGRVCELDGANGVRASEKFLAYDEDNKTCTIRIDFVDTFIGFPLDHNMLAFSIVDTGDNESEMTWAFRSQLKPWAYLLWPFIRIVLGVFVGQIMAELQYFVENGTPHPRKIKAMKGAKRVAGA